MPTFKLGLPCGSAGKEYARNAGGLGSIPGLGRSPGEGKGYSLQYSGLENSKSCKESDTTELLSLNDKLPEERPLSVLSLCLLASLAEE